MSDDPTEHDAKALARVMRDANIAAPAPGGWPMIARAVLASDWYAERIAQAHREGAAEVTARVETLADEWEHVGGGDPMGSAYAMGYSAAMRAHADDLRAALRGAA